MGKLIDKYSKDKIEEIVELTLPLSKDVYKFKRPSDADSILILDFTKKYKDDDSNKANNLVLAFVLKQLLVGPNVGEEKIEDIAEDISKLNPLDRRAIIKFYLITLQGNEREDIREAIKESSF